MRNNPFKDATVAAFQNSYLQSTQKRKRNKKFKTILSEIKTIKENK